MTTTQKTQKVDKKVDKQTDIEKRMAQMEKELAEAKQLNEKLQAEKQAIADEKRKQELKEKMGKKIALTMDRVKQSMLKDEKTRTAAQAASMQIASKPGDLVKHFHASNPITLGTIQGSHCQDGLLGIRLALLIQQGMFPEKFTETMKNDSLYDYETKCKQGHCLQDAGLLTDPMKLIS